jgi:hypothetical protein
MQINRRHLLTAAALIVAQTALGSALAGPLTAAARSAAARRAALAAAAKKPATAAAVPVGKPYDVVISRSRHPQAAAHIDHAQRQGQPSVVHIDRAGAAQRRAASTGSVDRHRKPGPHYERDEYPPAMVREGGHNANVRYIDRHDNRGAGSSMRSQTQHLPDGARIRIVVGE